VTTPSFPCLFSPLAIGSVTLPNRIVSSGHDTVMARDGHVTDRLIAYHGARARGYRLVGDLAGPQPPRTNTVCSWGHPATRTAHDDDDGPISGGRAGPWVLVDHMRHGRSPRKGRWSEVREACRAGRWSEVGGGRRCQLSAAGRCENCAAGWGDAPFRTPA